MRQFHWPRRHNLRASCNERLERNEGQHLLEDKGTGRRCLAFLLQCCGSRSPRQMGNAVAHVGKYYTGSSRRSQLNPLTRGEGQVHLGLVRLSVFLFRYPLSRPAKMSALRGRDRRAARNQLSSPYKRSNAKPKKSVRSLHHTSYSQSSHICSSPGPCHPFSAI